MTQAGPDREAHHKGTAEGGQRVGGEVPEVPREIATLVTIVARVGLGDRSGEQEERRGGTDGKGLHRAPIQQEPFRFANKKVAGDRP